MIYAKPSSDLVFDLIAESNPVLPITLSKAHCRFGVPRKVVGYGPVPANTEIDVYPRLPSGYVNKATVRYRRLSLLELFKGVAPEVKKYTDAPISSSPFSTHALLPVINQTFGLSLTTDDIVDLPLPPGSDGYYPNLRSVKVVLRAKDTSLGFVGEIMLRWVFLERDLSEIITETELDGRTYPDGNDFEVSHKYILDLLSYGIDFTELSADYESGVFQASPMGMGSAATLAAQQRTLDYISLYAGVTLSKDVANAPFGIKNAVATRYVLPNPAVPHANPNFSAVVVVSYPTQDTWATGQLYIHYNF